MGNISTSTTPLRNSGGSSPQRPSHRERDDNYQRVIVELAPRCRIIVCKDGIQWILQKRSAEPSHSGEWRGDSYVTDRDALIELSVKRGLLSDPSKLAILEALPPQTHNTPVAPCNSLMEDE